VWQLSYNIETGPHPSHPGACIAQYNHHIQNHSPKHKHNPNHHQYIQQNYQPIMPYIPQPTTVYSYYGLPYWTLPGPSFPNLY
jgi:hypothetical protein